MSNFTAKSPVDDNLVCTEYKNISCCTSTPLSFQCFSLSWTAYSWSIQNRRSSSPKLILSKHFVTVIKRMPPLLDKGKMWGICSYSHDLTWVIRTWGCAASSAWGRNRSTFCNFWFWIFRSNFWIWIFTHKYIKLTCCFWMGCSALPMNCWTIFYGFIFDGSLLLKVNSEGRRWLQRKRSTLATSRTGIAAPSDTHKFIF